MEKAVGIKRDEKLKEIYSSRFSQKKKSAGVGYRIICKIDKIEAFDFDPETNKEQIVLVTTDTINEINTGCNMDMKKKNGESTKITFPGVDNFVIKPLPSVNLVAKHVGATKGGNMGVSMVINM